MVMIFNFGIKNIYFELLGSIGSSFGAGTAIRTLTISLEEKFAIHYNIPAI